MSALDVKAPITYFAPPLHLDKELLPAARDTSHDSSHSRAIKSLTTQVKARSYCSL